MFSDESYETVGDILDALVPMSDAIQELADAPMNTPLDVRNYYVLRDCIIKDVLEELEVL